MLARVKSVGANLLIGLFCVVWPLVAYGVSPLFGLFLGVFLWPGAIYHLARALTLRVEPDLRPRQNTVPLPRIVEVPTTGRIRGDNHQALLNWVSVTHPGWPRSTHHKFAAFVTDYLGDHRWDGTPTSPQFSHALTAYFSDRKVSGPRVELRAIRSTKQLWHPALKKRMASAPRTDVTQHFRVMIGEEEVGLVVLDVWPDTDEVVLYELFINPAMRRTGNGTATLKAVEDHAWRIGRRRVLLRPRQIDPSSMSDADLTRWYQARGYSKASTVNEALEKRLK